MPSGKLSDYLGKGLIAARPVSLDLTAGAVGIYFATDTPDIIYLWDGSEWVEFEANKDTPPPAPSPTYLNAYLPELAGVDGEFLRVMLTKDGALASGAVTGSIKTPAAKVLDVNKNAVKVGEVTISAAGVVSFTATSAGWSVGDVLTLTGTDDAVAKGLSLLFTFAPV